jgi:hypothetical protein
MNVHALADNWDFFSPLGLVVRDSHSPMSLGLMSGIS